MPTRKPKKRTSKKPSTPDVVVRVDAKLKKAYDALVAVIEQSTDAEMRDFDRRWEAAGAIVDHDPPLYVVGGHRDADEFFEKVMHEVPRTASRYVRVARFASPTEEKTLGIAKLDAVLSFIQAKLGEPLAHPPLPVAFDRLRIPVGDGTKSVESATVAEIDAARRKLQSATRKRPKSAARDALESSLAAVGSLENVKVSERGGVVSFTGIPLAAFERFVKAVAKAKLPR